jgi:UDP-glucose 4-epimerase
MPTALVTGVAGFIGSHVADACLNQGFNVVGLDDLSGGFRQNVSTGVDFVEGSVCDVSLVKKIFSRHKIDYVYHLAAYAAEGLSHFIRRFNYTNNVIGSVTLINEAAAADVKCFVFTSSIAVYGTNQLPMAESLVPRPEDPYGIAKYAIEMDLRAANRMFGMPYIVFRPHNVYGERQNLADRYRNVVGIFMNGVMQGRPMTIFGSGEQSRAFSHIADVAPIIARSPLVPRAYGETFNIGADAPCTVRELATLIAEAFGVAPVVEHLPPREEVEHAFADHGKVTDVFRAEAQVSLKEGLRRMAAWAREHGSATPCPLRPVELDKNVPSAWTRTEVLGGQAASR